MPPQPSPANVSKSRVRSTLARRDHRITPLHMIQERTAADGLATRRHDKRLCFGPFLAILPN
jgi:hypothetical protein